MTKRKVLALVLPILWGMLLGHAQAQAQASSQPLPTLPRVRGPFTLQAVTDPASGLSQFRFRGAAVPPVLHVSPGHNLVLTYRNDLSSVSREKCLVVPCTNASNLHFHGLHVSPNSPQDDELTMLALPGQSLRYTVQVPLDQPPGLYWYHTHPHHESYQQDLDGMSGAIVVDGIDRYVPMLRRMPERILVLRDQLLDDKGPRRAEQLRAVSLDTRPCGSAQGDPERAFTVNGAVRPTIELASGEKQFWRIVNTSPDLYADLEIPGSSLNVVALDGMPLAYHDPSTMTRSYRHVLLPPAGRVEAIVTGVATPSALVTRCFDAGADGDPNPAMVVANIVNRTARPAPRPLTEAPGTAVHHPISASHLGTIEQASPQFTATFTEDKNGFYINGAKFSMTSAPLLTVPTGSYQRWTIVNRSNEVHPFHIHQVHFLAYRQNGAPLSPPVWLDTVNVPPMGSVDLVMDFTDPIIRGTSLFHCHLLKHEDKGMMAKIVFE